jgi:hypothetical protein
MFVNGTKDPVLIVPCLRQSDGVECSAVGLSFHLRSSVDALRIGLANKSYGYADEYELTITNPTTIYFRKQNLPWQNPSYILQT